ncbi:MAG: DNA repair protein RadA [Flavobacteriaceae bacterium]|nr:DNA repair protein RadA [Flavobacteriaceae bacterium]
MAKSTSIYVCQSCGNKASKWLGKCPQCGEWNSYLEEIASKDKGGKQVATGKAVPIALQQIESGSTVRITTADAELDRVLGGGIVPGSLILIGGDPGIGKSTLMLQAALSFAGGKVLYVSGEESESQIKLRAERLPFSGGNCYILTETNSQAVIRHAKELQPGLVIIDSIQTLRNEYIESAPGSVSQIRECAADFLRYAKDENVPVFLVGHITKDGSLAGPKVLEHMVDTVLQFEGDHHHTYRILRTVKNRFGSTSEIGIYEMQGSGLRQVNNPSEILISHRDEAVSGIAVTGTMEGLRPMLVETQALVSSAVYGTPQRSANGYDAKRLNMLLAVLEKKCGFRLAVQDVFVNIAGGLKVDDPAIDLGIVAAILSSHHDVPLSPRSVFIGEVGLSGEIRAVNRIEQRLAEAEKLGYEEIYISKNNLAGLNRKGFKIAIKPVGKMEEFFGEVFG